MPGKANLKLLNKYKIAETDNFYQKISDRRFARIYSKITDYVYPQLRNNPFLSIDLTKDLTLFDIKQVRGNYDKRYFRLRKGKFRAIFYYDDSDIYVIYMGKREKVYDLWQ